MNFSDLFKQTNLLCEFSPNGKYLANVVQFRVIIRDINSLEITNLYTCLDTVNFIEVLKVLIQLFNKCNNFTSINVSGRPIQILFYAV